jgi:hypothetical protein
MPTPSIQTLVTDAQQVLNLDSISAVRSVVAVALANANTGTPLNPNLTTQQLWNEFYQVVNKPKSDIESIIANQLMKFLFAPPAPGGVGADQQVIFNDGGVLAGDPKFLWNKTTNLLTVAGSATITGDLTVASSILKVSGGNVGINTASPTNTAGYKTLEIVGTGVNTGGMIRMKSSDASVSSYDFVDNNGRGIFVVSNHNLRFGCNDIEQYRIQPLGIFTWYDGAGGTRMTLNSTGLGVGGVPSYKLDVQGTSAGVLRLVNILNLSTDPAAVTRLSLDGQGATWHLDNERTNGIFKITRNSTACLTIDNSGNVGIGVTPSAWGGSYKALQLQSVARNIAATGAGLGDFTVAFNAIYDSTDSRWEYAGTGDKAGRYSQTGSGNHRWFVSNTAGTAGNEITDFASPAMTLDASGNLLVGLTSPHLTGRSAFQNNQTGQVTFRNSSATAGRSFYIGMDSGSSMQVANEAGVGVYMVHGGTSWLALSDERLKDIIEPISNAVAKVGSLRSVIGKFKTDSEGTRRSFLIAQDVQSVLPEAVDSSNPDKIGLAYSEVIPLLVAAIKELTARVQTLEAK